MASGSSIAPNVMPLGAAKGTLSSSSTIRNALATVDALWLFLLCVAFVVLLVAVN